MDCLRQMMRFDLAYRVNDWISYSPHSLAGCRMQVLSYAGRQPIRYFSHHAALPVHYTSCIHSSLISCLDPTRAA